MRKMLGALVVTLACLASPALASNCSGNPFTLTNGTPADATQVMANFNNLLTCANNNLAHNGANSDITSLSGLSTPLSIAQGGTAATTSAAALTNLGAAALATSNVFASTNTFQGSLTVTAAGNIATTVQTTSTVGAGQFVTADNGSGTFAMTSYGTARASSTMGVSNASLSSLISNSAALVIGTAGGGGNFTLGTNNTAQLLLTSGGGLTTSGVAGGDKGAGSINAGTLFFGGTQVASAASLTTAQVFQVSNNLSEGTLATKQTNLGVDSDTSHTGFATTANGSGSFSTSLSSVGHVVPILVCTTNNAGWVAGDSVAAPATNDTTTNRGVIVGWNGTTVYWGIGSGGISIIPKAGGAATAITAADWTLSVYVYKQ